MKAPNITEQDVAAVDQALQLAQQLEDYAQKNRTSKLDQGQLSHAVEVLRSLHSALALIHIYQRDAERAAEHRTLGEFEDEA